MRRLVTLSLIVLLGLLVAAPYGAVQAQSQRPAPAQGPFGFFDLLFGPRPGGPPPQPRKPPPVETRRSSRPATPPVAVAEVTPKDENARKILVVGDFVAGGLAWGLGQRFADEPKIAVIDKSNNASGLVRDDYYDWNEQLPVLLNTIKPDIVVVVIGSNDRQPIRSAKGRPQPHSDAWEAIYTERIKEIAGTLKVFGRPYFWVSAPPMRASSAARDMTYFNGFYKPAVTAAGGVFIDIWNGFTGENGAFTSSGPDVDGQLRALRTGDGINFTRAGRLKLAFYVEREIRKHTGVGTGAVDLLASASQTGQIEIGPDGTKLRVGPVISLGDPLPGAAQDLLGSDGNKMKTMGEDTPQYSLVVKGEAPPDVAGRADDFAWPPRQRAMPTAASETDGADAGDDADATAGVAATSAN
jgi:hypothetical protein